MPNKATMASLKERAAEWMRLDPDSETKAEIQDLLDRKDHVELSKRLVGRIAFGTAGLRARMEAGFTRMNSLTVLQTTQGLAAYIASFGFEAKSKGVVIGRDARHNSKKFAKIAADCFTSNGIKVYWFSEVVHTPLVPFTVESKRATAGVMITASHNPKQDNGYKVYWSNGVQIIPPHDVGIAKAIEENLEPRPLAPQTNPPLLEEVDQSVRDAYSRTVQSLVPNSFQVPPFVYTPMHGVGFKPLSQTLPHLEFDDNNTTMSSKQRLHVVVRDQVEPDPDFPTVGFPNPEEQGALKNAKRVADRVSIDLILANDPDADRLCVAQKLDPGSDGERKWHQFTGNELGVLLASHMLEEMATSQPDQKAVFLSSTVSTSMLRAMAIKEGHRFVETLTGFKWLGNVACQLEGEDSYVPFAFEEALGYMFPSVVHDKDGIAAAIVFLAATAKWKAKGISPWEQLQQLYQKYGYFVEANRYMISPSADVTIKMFNNIRAMGNPYPTSVGDLRIKRWRDLTIGYDSATQHNKPVLPVDPTSQMITCTLDNNARFTIRGSGTEPKIKIYIDCQADTSEHAKKAADDTYRTLVKNWLKPDLYGLGGHS